MINQQLLDFIKSKLQEGISEKNIYKELIVGGWIKKDIKEGFSNLLVDKDGLYTNYKKVKKISKNEWLLIIFFILAYFVLGILALVSLFNFGLAGVAIGMLMAIGIGEMMNYLSLGIALFFLINIFRVFKIQSKVKATIKNDDELVSGLYKNFKKLCTSFYIINIIVIIFIIASFVFNIKDNTKRSDELKIQDQQAKEYNIKEYPNGLKRILSAFKEQISETQVAFTGYGAIPNNGDCVNPAIGSLFNPNLFDKNNTINPVFEPRSAIDPDWKNHSIVNSVDAAGPYLRNTTYNNISDARCFSNQDHYAFQLPSYLEDTFPVFYCIDDIHPGVQTNNKLIKGPDCSSLDDTYITPTTRPLPDIPSFK